MSGFYFILLAAALFTGSDSQPLNGKGLNGATWRALPGNYQAFCQVDDCNIKVVRRKSLAECATSCANRPGCRCAIYRAEDNYCAYKKYHCNSWRTGLKDDPSKQHYAADIRRPGVGPGANPPKPQPTGPKPTPAPAPAPAPAPVPIGRASGGAGVAEGHFKSLMTKFHGFGIPYGGCGVPMSVQKDDDGNQLPYVALNVHTSPPGGKDNFEGLFEKGANCGRWLKITVGKPCGGSNAGEDVAGCLANFNSGPSDGKDGTVIYGYVADSCADGNNWCRTDTYHVDMGEENLIRAGIADNWQNNRIEWSFLSGTPPGFKQSDVKYYWCIKAKMDWPCVIAAGLTNGISAIEAEVEDPDTKEVIWQEGWQQWILGQQWALPASNTFKLTNGKIKVRTLDVDGKSYGEQLLNLPPNEVDHIVAAN